MHLPNQLNKVLIFIDRKKRIISPIALILGFVIDSLTLQRVDNIYTHILLIGYLITLSLLIIVATPIKESIGKLHKIQPIINPLIFFIIGGLFSAFTVFYMRSTGNLNSYIFVTILVLIMLGSEYLKKYYSLLSIQIVLWYVSLLSYLIFALPVLTGKIGIWIFLFAIIISLGIASVFIKVVNKISEQHTTNRQHYINILITAIVIVVLYITNILPPVPLAMKHAGVYYNVSRDADKYIVTKQFVPWYSTQRYKTPVIYHSGNSKVYVATAIFAPNGLRANIKHIWQYYDSSSKSWRTTNEIPFNILGGRDNGFRAYSFKTNIKQGLWRVLTATNTGKIIGSIKFKVVDGNIPQNLITKRF